LLRGLGKNQNNQIEINALITREKKTAYGINQNKLEFFSSDKFNYNRLFAGITHFYLPNLNTIITNDVTYHKYKISDEIKQLNPSYLLNKTERSALSYYLALTQFKRDSRIYPLNAFLYKLEFVKFGLLPNDNINNTYLTGKINIHQSLSKNWHVSQLFEGKYDLSNKQQMFRLARALGNEERYVRGYELYVIDGQHFFMNRNTIKRLLFQRHISLPATNDKRFTNLPVKAYIKAFGDYGFVWDRFASVQNKLSNQALYSYGLGVDLLPLYSMVVRIEFARNHLKENGVFLHFNLDIGNDNSHIW
jgi:hypothetical protein